MKARYILIKKGEESMNELQMKKEAIISKLKEVNEQLTDEEKVTYFAAIKSLSVRLKKYRDNGKDYKTLQEILNATDEEMNYLSKIYPQNTRSYQFLVRFIFGYLLFNMHFFITAKITNI